MEGPDYRVCIYAGSCEFKMIVNCNKIPERWIIEVIFS